MRSLLRIFCGQFQSSKSSKSTLVPALLVFVVSVHKFCWFRFVRPKHINSLRIVLDVHLLNCKIQPVFCEATPENRKRIDFTIKKAIDFHLTSDNFVTVTFGPTHRSFLSVLINLLRAVDLIKIYYPRQRLPRLFCRFTCNKFTLFSLSFFFLPAVLYIGP